MAIQIEIMKCIEIGRFDWNEDNKQFFQSYSKLIKKIIC